MSETKYFDHELVLSPQSEPAGTRFPARIAYQTFGHPSNPAVFLPTCYGGSLADTTTFVYQTTNGVEPPLPPSKYFIIVAGLMGGGESSSPSNQPAPFNGADFPHVTYADNIHLQHALCTHLGVNHLFAYIGFSMGGQQAYHLSALYPGFATHAVCIAGSARTSAHNWTFLDGLRVALVESADYCDGRYGATGAVRGVRAFSRVWSAWGVSAAWFRARCWETLGHSSLEEFLKKDWDFASDANNLLAMLWTWQHGDIGLYFPEDRGDLTKTLGRIQGKMLLMPTRTDAYFVPEDSEDEVKHLKHGELKIVETIWGHIAGGGSGTKEDTAFMQNEIARFLSVSSE